MAQPHKHAALIHAWADGAEIEAYDGYQWQLALNPTWRPNESYRIKPHIEQRRYRVALFRSDRVVWTETVDTPAEADHTADHKHFHSWLTDWTPYEVEVPEELL